MNIFKQVFTMKLWMLMSFILGTAIISACLTTVLSQSSQPQALVCPPCKQVSPSEPLNSSPSRNSYRVPNDNGKTY